MIYRRVGSGLVFVRGTDEHVIDYCTSFSLDAEIRMC